MQIMSKIYKQGYKQGKITFCMNLQRNIHEVKKDYGCVDVIVVKNFM